MTRRNDQLWAAIAKVLDAWPEDPGVAEEDDWITADDLAAWLVKEGAVPDVPLTVVLNQARRKGWVLRTRRDVQPEAFKLTPSGDAYARTALAQVGGPV